MTLHRFKGMPLKRVAAVMPSSVDKHSVEGEQSVRLCNYVDVYRNERISEDLDFMQATASDAQIARFTLRAHDVLVTKDSEEPTDIGIPAYVAQDLPGVVCGYHLAVLRPDSSRIYGGFMHWALQSSEVHDYYSTAATGISRYALSVNDLGMTPLRLPDLAEQVRIANFLDKQTARIDALIAEKERLAESLRDWYAAELTRICFGTDREQTDTGNLWIPRGPSGWAVARLKHIVAGIEQGWSPECENRLADEDGWGVLKAGAANGGTYRESEHKALPSDLHPVESLEVKPGDVLVTRASGTAEYVGSFAYVYATRPRLMLSDKNFRVRFNEQSRLMPELLAWICNTHSLREQIGHYVSGAEGLAKNIGSGSLKEIWLPVPPQEEQPALVNQLQTARTQYAVITEHLEAHIDRLREYRSSLISAAVTGQLDLRTFKEAA